MNHKRRNGWAIVGLVAIVGVALTAYGLHRRAELLKRRAGDEAFTREFLLRYSIQQAVQQADGNRLHNLLDQGSGIEVRIALQQAASRGETGLVRSLLKDPRISLAPRDYAGLLGTASCFGYTQLVEFLLDHGAPANARCGARTALHWAASRGYARIARILLDHGADVDMPVLGERDPDNSSTPLMLAARYRHPDVVALLLQRHARVDARDRAGQTALGLIRCACQSTAGSAEPGSPRAVHLRRHAEEGERVVQLLVSAGAGD